jgi:predicted enzyme related to lactoylglutathione lyase
MLRIQCLCIDTTDPALLANFWSGVLGWPITDASDEEVSLEPPEGSGLEGVVPDILFLRVLETKGTKNRLHIDLRPDDQDAEVDRIIALGASRADIGQGDDVSWVVLQDPDGNEFCVLRALAPASA